METFNHFINGQSTPPASGEYIDTDNPYTGEVWGRIARGTAADVDAAAAAAADAFPGWKATTPTARGKLLVKLAELIEPTEFTPKRSMCHIRERYERTAEGTEGKLP